MTTYDAIVLNDTTIKVNNSSDYYVDQWIYTDYGFELWYRKPRGMKGGYWNKLLDGYGFPHREERFATRAYPNIIYIETRVLELDLAEFIKVLHSFVLNFTSGGKLYSLIFDEPTFTIHVSDSESYWDYL